MKERMQSSLREFQASKPGRRFRDRYYRRHETARSRFSPSSLLYSIGGVLLVIASLFLGPAPGFGFGTAFIGLALLASEFLSLAKFLDYSEVRLRDFGREMRDIWRTLPAAGRVLLVLIALAIAVAFLYGLYWLLFV